jgi:stage V sporulation protein R
VNNDWRGYADHIERLAQREGMTYYPMEFEQVPDSFMMEIAIYGLPVRMPHWSFGLRYMHQLLQHRMGNSRVFEVMFPGNPGRAYLSEGNGLAANLLVVAHVLGHADFAHNNGLFRTSQAQIGDHIVEQAAAHARRIADAIDEYGAQRVEALLDAALALEQHIDVDKPLRRERYPEYASQREVPSSEFGRRFAALEGLERPTDSYASRRQRAAIPPHPERDLLWLLANYAPELEGWERDVLLAVREESFYFYPVFACQIMNEGWASFWHARLMREANFLPGDVYLDAIKCHCDVVRPVASGEDISLRINPYHLGFTLWEHVVKEQGIEAARRIVREDDDCSFIRNHLTVDRAAELDLFRYEVGDDGRVSVGERDISALHEAILSPKYNFGAPRIAASSIGADGTLALQHDHATDGRGLDEERSTRVLEYIRTIWRRPVEVHTIDGHGKPLVLASRREAA